MNPAPYLRLLWKEYRAIRGFWLALIVLALGAQLLILQLSNDTRWNEQFVYNVALATPVFFALGCIGTSFALEKEEGTFDWLRASPATSRQVFTSKLALCILATLAMNAVLWPLALWFNANAQISADSLRTIAGIWLPATLEAIAWGLLFSLLLQRPLPAIVLALVVASTVTHLLTWTVVPGDDIALQLDAYLKAIPWRMLMIAPVLVCDVVLGLRWLENAERPLIKPKQRPRSLLRKTRDAQTTTTSAAERLQRPDWFTMAGRLLWQHTRQASRLMMLMASLQVLMTLLLRFARIGREQAGYEILPLVGFAALMGGMVFLTDQERHGYRFFIEHNVPPRLVWFTRLLPWMLVATFSSLLSAAIWLGWEGLASLYRLLAPMVANGDGWVTISENTLYWPAVSLGLLGAILSFTAGQWISMLVRSGLLAGFFSIVFCLLLTGWFTVVVFMELSWPLFLLPIPIVLLFATWLRAPDWIAETTTWQARLRAAGSVAIPALLMLSAVPMARLWNIPAVDPGFVPACYLDAITPESLETGQMYRKASELVINIPLPGRDVDSRWPLFLSAQPQQLAESQEGLDLTLEASRRPSCVVANPATLHSWPEFNPMRLSNLLRASGRQLEAEGKLDDALARYLLMFKVQSDLANYAPITQPWVRGFGFGSPNLGNDGVFIGYRESFNLAFSELVGWAMQPAQTDERLRQAIAALQALDANGLHLDEGLKSDYVLIERILNGEHQLDDIFSRFFINSDFPRYRFVRQYMPWEKTRDLRLLSHGISRQLTNLTRCQYVLQSNRTFFHGGGRPFFLPYTWAAGIQPLTSEAVQLALRSLAEFESLRRATMLTLACQAYRLQHGQLPPTLDTLVGNTLGGDAYFTQLPNDPYTGEPYYYVPDGIPPPQSDFEPDANGGDVYLPKVTLGFGPSQVGTPGLWSPGPDGSEGTQKARPSNRRSWRNGDWYPIPNSRAKVSEAK